jgi:UDP-N-acetylmuramoylalanine--D-glutamate ligase
MRITDLAGLRVAIWGYGREGRAVLATLRERLPDLSPTLFCAPQEFDDAVSNGVDSAQIVAQAPNAAQLSSQDVVIKSPGISAYRPEIIEARRNGTRFTSATAFWFAEHPDARVIAVTGTKGKSTTSALIAHLLRGLGRRTALAGNIGKPLLELLAPEQNPEWWVLELSSFQTREASGVELAVITNLEEEHLDWHGDREHYVEDKLALAEVARCVLVNAGQDEVIARTARHPQRATYANAAGWHVESGWICRGDQRIFDTSRLPLPGVHNAVNACAALAALECVGEDAVAAAKHLATFHPLPHRLQTLGTRDGLRWIDDSIATTPQASLQALSSLRGERICLILGGHDRGLDWRAFAEKMKHAAPYAIVLNGANRERVADVLADVGGDYALLSVPDLAQAVALARRLLGGEGVVLMSPGAPSFDQFRDYAERGRAFAKLGGFDPEQIGHIEGLGIH